MQDIGKMKNLTSYVEHPKLKIKKWHIQKK